MPKTVQAQADKRKIAAPEKLTLLDLLKILTPGQVWALLGCVVAIVVASVSIGSWAQSAHDDEKIAEKNALIQDLKSRSGQDTANVEAARSSLKIMQANVRALRGKAEFLDRFLAYELSARDPAKQLFINYVCALWKQSQELSIHIDRAPLNLSEWDLRSGLTPEVRQFLSQNGVPDHLLDQAAGPDTARVFPNIPDITRTPSFAVNKIQGILQGGNLTLQKRVRLFDDTTYEVPNEIAAAVHEKKDCAPQ
ncbi:hypothetical protein [Bradyrhizobium sp. HKCCYLRH3061]|uniref:hypothetical protein n=1 Tax=Bradyrhizobium sp. HKCCYLRH3061 TaxID=3420734 RepID=UPI003EBDDC41